MSALSPTIRQVLDRHPLGAQIAIKGWVRTVRRQKKLAFLQISDGSTAQGLQAVADCGHQEALAARIDEVTTGCSIALWGTLCESPAAHQNLELKIEQIEIIGPCDPSSYPLQKKHHTLEYLRTIGHLRSRTNTLGAVARLRSALALATHRYFHEREFLLVPTPIITTSDCEGGGDLFRIQTSGPAPKTGEPEEFFGKPAYLTVSGQLNAEVFASSHSRVYTFGPTFRAENSNTSRHLAEFWMIEPEMAFADLSACADVAEEYVQFVLRCALQTCGDDIAFFERHYAPGLTARLHKWSTEPFKRIDYTEAIEILQKSGKAFSYPCTWGCDLQSEHERYLTEVHFQAPLAVLNYPSSLKPFYARLNDDERTVGAMDVLMPQIGEIIGGSQREERYDVLLRRFEELQLRREDYWWYLELRQFGSVPHSGFGAGFERLVRLVTGLDNVRDIAPFPRTPGHAEF